MDRVCDNCKGKFEEEYEVCPHCGNIYEETSENISALAPEKESEVEVPDEEKLEKKNDEFFIIKNFKIEMDKLIKILVGIVAILLVVFMALLVSGNDDSNEMASPTVTYPEENASESVEELNGTTMVETTTSSADVTTTQKATTTKKVTTTAIPSIKDITNLKKIVNVFEGYCITPCGISTDINDCIEYEGMVYERAKEFNSNAELNAYVAKFVSNDLMEEHKLYKCVERNGKLYAPEANIGYIGTDLDNARLDGVLSDGTYVVSAYIGESWSDPWDIVTYHFKKINGTFKLVGYKG